MAHRIIAQVVIVGTQVFGKAFISAWRQAAANSARVSSSSSSTSSTGSVNDSITRSTGLSVSEACQILNLKEKEGLKVDDVVSRYKTMFEANDPGKGGSFYIQSKVLRAKERLEMELSTAAAADAAAATGDAAGKSETNKTGSQTTPGP